MLLSLKEKKESRCVAEKVDVAKRKEDYKKLKKRKKKSKGTFEGKCVSYDISFSFFYFNELRK